MTGGGPMTAWALEGLTKVYRRRDLLGRTHARPALDGVDLRVLPGERVAVIGESGSGKTTLARAGLGLLRPDGGRIAVLGEDATAWTRRRWQQARRHVQLLFQDPRAMLNPSVPLRLLLEESARLHTPDRDPREEARRVLAEVGLDGRHEALPDELSGGERRRAGIARVLLARPRLLVADEPTAGLDAALKATIVRLLVDRAGPDCAIVLISHDLPTVTWACSRVIVLHEGRVVDAFPVDAMLAAERHPRTRALLSAAGLAEGAA